MTGKLKLGERDWLWPLGHYRWKSKKSDWLDLGRMIVRKITRHGEADFHVRNHPQRFRELRRQERFVRAQKKLEELWEDENSVLHYVHESWDTIAKFDEPIVTRDEALTELGLSIRLKDDILRLLDKLSGSTGDINALWRVIETAGHVGRFMGEHPHRRKLRTNKGRGTILTKVQRQREILTPLILAEDKINPVAVPKRTFAKANELLIAKGMKPLKPRRYAELVSKIIKPAE
jgi:hypothetical protein